MREDRGLGAHVPVFDPLSTIACLVYPSEKRHRVKIPRFPPGSLRSLAASSVDLPADPLDFLESNPLCA
jgi:hypothetical protein